MLKMTDHILLTLAGIRDFYDFMAPTRQEFLRDLNPDLYPQYKKPSLLATFYRLLSTEHIAKVTKNGKAYYQITTKGLGKLQRLFPLSKFAQQKWDGQWRLVIFDVKEKNRLNRELIRAKLKELGFAMLQKSVWVSPYDIEEDLDSFLKSHRLKKGVLFLTASKISVQDEKDLAERLWHLEELNEDYEDLLDIWQETLQQCKTKPALLKKKAAEWEQKYYAVLLKDPHLPKKLLPGGVWYGQEAQELYQKAIYPLRVEK